MRKNLPTIVALVLPLLVVAGVLLVIYIPTIGFEPGYNMVYAVDNNRWNNDFRYVVEDEKIKEVPYEQDEDDFNRMNPRIFVYDFAKEQSEEISFEEVEDLVIVKEGDISPDNYLVEPSYSRSGGIIDIFGGYSRDYGWNIMKDGKEVFREDNRRYYGIDILGWTEK